MFVPFPCTPDTLQYTRQPPLDILYTSAVERWPEVEEERRSCSTHERRRWRVVGGQDEQRAGRRKVQTMIVHQEGELRLVCTMFKALGGTRSVRRRESPLALRHHHLLEVQAGRYADPVLCCVHVGEKSTDRWHVPERSSRRPPRLSPRRRRRRCVSV